MQQQETFDRFISQRQYGEDFSQSYQVKKELFARQPAVSNVEDDSESDTSMNGANDQSEQDHPQNSNEDQRTYVALLQSQVLGVSNKALLNEIHNCEDYHASQQNYTRMQKWAEQDGDCAMATREEQQQHQCQSAQKSTHNLLSKESLSPFVGDSGAIEENSPYKSKFAVLKFSPTKSSPGPKKVTSSVKSSQKSNAGKLLSPGGIQSSPLPMFNYDSPAKEASVQSMKLNPVRLDDANDCQPVDLFGSGAFDESDQQFAMRLQSTPTTQLNSTSKLEQSPANLPYAENEPPLENFTAPIFDKRSLFIGLDEDELLIPQAKQRVIAKNPYKVLDAPALQDDYYLNLVDWSSQNDLVVGLQSCIYIWSASSSKVTKLYDLGQNDTTTSVNWARTGSHLAVGTDTGLVQVWDVAAQRLVRVYHGHEGRVGALAWTSSLLSSGSKDRTILNRDLRDKSDYVSKLAGHKQEVCGLKWSLDEQQIASGGNDNKLLVWSPHRQSEPLWRFASHKAAVKALAFSPHQKGLLVSGGGTADRCIKFWNTMQGLELQTIQTESQVCNLMFSRNSQELVSTHGYSENAVCIWKYPSMRKIATLMGHNLRVLYLAMSPDGESIVTGAGDETLRFWKVFPEQKKVEKPKSLIQNSAFVIR